jgi:hypothetical protein
VEYVAHKATATETQTVQHADAADNPNRSSAAKFGKMFKKARALFVD